MSRIEHNEANSIKIRKVAEDIEGTCDSLDEYLQEAFGDESLTVTDIDIKLLDELDALTMECTECGWWCEASELNDDQVCEDCFGLAGEAASR